MAILPFFVGWEKYSPRRGQAMQESGWEILGGRMAGNVWGNVWGELLERSSPHTPFKNF
jgi:hypothetical protein